MLDTMQQTACEPSAEMPEAPTPKTAPGGRPGADALFRPEVLVARGSRLDGEVSIGIPVSWEIIAYLLGGAVIAALAFLSFSSYSRSETATGTIVADRGVAPIVPSRAGTVAAIAVQEGAVVRPGAELLSVRSEQDMASGGTTGEEAIAALSREDGSLVAQASANRLAGAAKKQQIAAQQGGLSHQIDDLQDQMKLQQQLVDSAKLDYERTKPIAARGFISKNELQVREDTILSRTQQLAQLAQTLNSLRSSFAENARSLAQVDADTATQVATVEASRSQVAQQVATAQGQRSYVLRAPVAGRVTALTARVGQAVDTGQSLMVIVPKDAVLRVELDMPTSAIGFVRVGQEVRLAIDAFPYDQYGTIRGRIVNITGAPVSRVEADGVAHPVYIVTADLVDRTIKAYGQNQQLVPGMTLQARIVTAKQSLLEWLFQPIFAVGRR